MAKLQRESVYTLGLLRGFGGKFVEEFVVCEVGSVVANYSLLSHIWWCANVVYGATPFTAVPMVVLSPRSSTAVVAPSAPALLYALLSFLPLFS